MRQAKKGTDAVPIQAGNRGQVREKHGLYSELDLATLDGRTKLAKAVRALREDLRAFVGHVTPTAELLIQQVAYKAARLLRYQANHLEHPEDSEAGHYLPMSNSLRLDLAALANMAGKPKAPDLGEYLAGLQEVGGE